jgi:hypothetical protein
LIRAKVCAIILSIFGVHGHAAVAVATCESRLDPKAVNSSRHVGLFQVSYYWHHRPGESFAQFRQRLIDPRRNALVAYRLSKGGTTWQAWTCRP